MLQGIGTTPATWDKHEQACPHSV